MENWDGKSTVDCRKGGGTIEFKSSHRNSYPNRHNVIIIFVPFHEENILTRLAAALGSKTLPVETRWRDCCQGPCEDLWTDATRGEAKRAP